MVIMNAVQLAGNAKIASRFAKFDFSILVPGVANAQTALNNIAPIKVALTRQHRTYGLKQVIFPLPLVDLLEIATHLEGAIHTLPVNGGLDTQITATLELANVTSRGSINPIENEVFTLDVTAIPATIQVTVETLEFPGDTKMVYDYQPIAIFPNAPTPVNIEAADMIAFDRSLLVQVEMHYPGGQKCLYTPANIQRMTEDYKQIVYNQNGVITPGGALFHTLDAGAAVKALVTYSAAGNVIVVNSKLV